MFRWSQEEKGCLEEDACWVLMRAKTLRTVLCIRVWQGKKTGVEKRRLAFLFLGHDFAWMEGKGRWGKNLDCGGWGRDLSLSILESDSLYVSFAVV